MKPPDRKPRLVCVWNRDTVNRLTGHVLYENALCVDQPERDHPESVKAKQNG